MQMLKSHVLKLQVLTSFCISLYLLLDYNEIDREDASDTDVIMDNVSEGLDRISLVLGSEAYPLVKDKILEYSKSEDWRYRWTALKAIMYTCEGCSAVFKNDVKQGIPR